MGMLATLLAGLASGETAAAIRRAKLGAVVYTLAAVFFVVGAGFFIGAAYMWAAVRYGPIETALGFGVAFVVVAGLIVLMFKLSADSRSRRRARRRKADLAAVGATTALALLPTLLRGKVGLGAIIGPAIALAAYAIYRENVKPPPGSDEG